jgi:hypothetical protein
VETRTPCFAEPTVPHDVWGRYGASGDRVEWLDRSTKPRARGIREYLNRTLTALPPDAAATLCHRLRHDPPFGRPYFELVVGRFLQILGAEVDHEPTGVGGRRVDWRGRFPDGSVVYVEATSPLYNQQSVRERLRREALIGVIEDEMPRGWWVIPRSLPPVGLHDSRQAFRRAVNLLLRDLPDPEGYSIENRLHITAPVGRSKVVLELWPGDPVDSPIAMVAMGAHYDDSALRVSVAARAKRHQARAFPGEAVLLAIDGPFLGPDVEDFDSALLGRTVLEISLDSDATALAFKPDGALVTQRVAEYAGVLAFGRVSVHGANEPILYRHPRFAGTLPPELLELRQRFLEGGLIAETPAVRTSIMAGLGFPSPVDD